MEITVGQRNVSVPVEAMGTRYLDGGYDISEASEIGYEIVKNGVGYIDRHGTAWASVWDCDEEV